MTNGFGTPWWSRIREELFDLRRDEWPRALLLSSFFFLIIAVFWVVKPIKRGLLLSKYDDAPLTVLGWTLQAAELEQLGKVLNMFVALVLVAAFTRLVRVLKRRHLLLALCGGLGLGFLLFAMFVGTEADIVVWTLYVFGDMYTTLMVATFWALTNDLTRNGEAERSYGVIGLGGVVGGFVGATAVHGWVETTGRAPLLFGCAGAMVVLAALSMWVERDAARRGRRGHELSSNDGASVWLEGARLAFRSRYLLAVVGLVALYETVSNIVDFQLSAVVQLQIEGSTEKDAFFGLVGQITGIVSIATQLLLTSWVMRRFGLAVALVVLPVAILGGSVGFLILPSLALAAVMSTSDNALAYSINQSAKEALYVPLSRDEKYKAKAFIDMFVQRTAKVFAVGINLAMAAVVGLGGVRWLSPLVLALLGVWIAVARWVGNRNAVLLQQADEPQPRSDRHATP